MTKSIDPEIRNFIWRHIDSVEQLEILLLLNSSQPKTWTVQEVNVHLQSSPSSVEGRLRGLCSMGLLIKKGDQFGYELGKNQDFDRIMDRLHELYKQKRNRVIELIFSKPTDILRDFSDAFKIRKGPHDG